MSTEENCSPQRYRTRTCRGSECLGSLLLFLGLLVSSPVLVAGQPATGNSPLVFGFLPVVSSERLVKRFSPLVDYIAERLNIETRMETAPDFQTFIRRTRDEKRYDILFTAPHLYYLANQKPGYRAIVRVDSPGMKAVIVTRADSAVKSLEDLRGRRLSTTDPLALATVLARGLLLDAGIDPDRDLELVATPSHNASLLSSYRGTTDASVLILPLYRRARADVRDAMRIIAETDSVPHMPLAVAPWIDAGLTEQLRTALIELNTTQAGRSLLRQLDWPGFTAVQTDEYDTFQSIVDQLGNN